MFMNAEYSQQLAEKLSRTKDLMVSVLTHKN